MTVALDTPRRAGGVAVAAVIERIVRAGPLPGVSYHAVKRPLAILMRCDAVTRAFAIDGAEIALKAFDARFPGQIDAFERLIAARPPSATGAAVD